MVDASPSSAGRSPSSTSSGNGNSGGLFGAPPPPPPPPPPRASSGGLFGNVPTNGGRLFGGRAATPALAPAPASTRDSEYPERVFASFFDVDPWANTSNGIFGTPVNTPPRSSGIFGTPLNPPPRSNGLFGNPLNPPPRSSGLFGPPPSATPSTTPAPISAPVPVPHPTDDDYPRTFGRPLTLRSDVPRGYFDVSGSWVSLEGLAEGFSSGLSEVMDGRIERRNRRNSPRPRLPRRRYGEGGGRLWD